MRRQTENCREYTSCSGVSWGSPNSTSMEENARADGFFFFEASVWFGLKGTCTEIILGDPRKHFLPKKVVVLWRRREYLFRKGREWVY